MKKFFVFFAVFTAMILAVSCGEGSKTDDTTDTGETIIDEDPSNTDSTTEPTEPTAELPEEGIYLGIIGFNEYLQPYPPQKKIGLLDSSTENGYKTFIDSLTSADGTSLYFADYTALGIMRDYTPVPTKLKNIALVTFTDGLDNISLANDDYNPENYDSHATYRNALHEMIVNEKIHGLNVAAYTIGLKGKDVTDTTAFEETLKKLASNDNNVFQVSDINEVNERFKEIAQNLYSVSKTVSLTVKVPGGYDDGQHLRFTFDNPNAATNSNLYIEATFRRSGGRTLEDVTYHGFDDGEPSIQADSSQGAYYYFKFEELKYDGSDAYISDTDINRIMLWKETNNGGWDKESEFNPESSSTVTENKNSALIMLVLDCTTSLGNDFVRMKQAGKDFVTTLNGSNNSSTETRVSDCKGKPEHAQWNTASKITQTWSGEEWLPTTEGSYSETASRSRCYFKCESDYEWDGTKCVNQCYPNPCSILPNSTGTCTINESSYVCGCKTGSEWNGLSCIVDLGNLPQCSSTSATPCKDLSSTLIWSAKASSAMTWQNAVDYCSSYSENGLSNWHLPKISELRTLIQNCSGTITGGLCAVNDPNHLSSGDYSSNCYCDEDLTGKYSKFGEIGWFWSSSTQTGNNRAWRVIFSKGGVYDNNKSSEGYVRCVRNAD